MTVHTSVDESPVPLIVPFVVHALPGRLRVHLPGWSGAEPGRIESRPSRVSGVLSARATPLTGNVLIGYDPRATDAPTLLRVLRALGWPKDGPPAGAKGVATEALSRPRAMAAASRPVVLRTIDVAALVLELVNLFVRRRVDAQALPRSRSSC